jgi:hypothetical protein
MTVQRPDEIGEARRSGLGPVQAEVDGDTGLGRRRGQDPERHRIGRPSDRVHHDRRRVTVPAAPIGRRGEDAAPGDLVDGGGYHGDHVRTGRIRTPGDLLTRVADLDVGDDHGARPCHRPDPADGGQPGSQGQRSPDLDPAERR